MKISLMIPCFVDQLTPRVGVAMTEVLQRLGHEVDYPDGQTCCGQPAFNCGYMGDARDVARRVLRCFERSESVVVPSGSCAAMLRVIYRELFQDDPDRDRAAALAAKTWEFSELLADRLGALDVGARLPGTATFHDGCHGLRELGVKSAPRRLLERVADLRLVEMTEAESCCGFGGMFSVKFPQISTAMAEVKALSVDAAAADFVVSNDPSCLLQLGGYFSRTGRRVKCLHIAEVLASR